MPAEQDLGRNVPRIIRNSETPPTYVGRPELPKVYSRFYLSEGESPFGYPPEYPVILEELQRSGQHAESGLHYPQNQPEKAKQFVRERFGLSERPYIVFSDGGSDAIMEKLPSLFTIAPDVWGIGAHFPPFTNYITERYMNYKAIYTALEAPPEESLELAMEMTDRQDTPKELAIFTNQPESPRGAVASIEVRRNFIADQEKKGILVILDEVFGDAIPDNESAVKLTDVFNNLIVLKSLSKTLGMPGERLGYAIMSEGIGTVFEKHRRNYDLKGSSILFLDRIMDNTIILPHIQTVVRKTVEVKADLVEKLGDEHIEVLASDPRVNIFTIRAPRTTVDQLENLSVNVASGNAFRKTHPEFYLDKLFRVTIPPDISQNPELVRRMVLAFNTSDHEDIPDSQWQDRAKTTRRFPPII